MPTPAAPVIGAAIDIGSTSVHLLVAELHGHRTRTLIDESELLRLGATVDADGALGAAARIRLIGTLLRYAEAARHAGATTLSVVGTEPLRRAADAPQAVAEIEAATGLGVHVLEHDEEGLLTFLGVTGGRPVDREVLVVDVGGGSSEFVHAGPEDPPAADGLRVGAARLTGAIVAHDPPTGDELHRLLDEARRMLRGAPDVVPERLVVVGGTASNLLRVVPGAGADRALSRRRIAAAMVMLAHQPADAVAAAHGINPHRARILPAGAAIMGAILERYRVPRLRVSEAGIREGAVLAAAHAGDHWRAELRALTRGWPVRPDDGRPPAPGTADASAPSRPRH
jgi:exopolyphosphatase/guanosine-5'-triphosphate,3'-diphosphate pyrophosphatase